MLKQIISDGIIRYDFPASPGRHDGTNIYAVWEGDKVILIDAGYIPQAQQVLDDLMDKGFSIEGVVISHFHEDHMEGLQVLPKTTVYGGAAYQTTLDTWTEKDEHHYYTPAVPVRDTYTIALGGHTLVLIPFPGHSQCTLLTMIDDTYLHIADEMLFSDTGEPILPCPERYCIGRHVESLNRLKAYDQYILLPAHGLPLSGAARIRREIDNRAAYLRAVLCFDGEISYEEAIRKCDCSFLHSEWHKYVRK